MADLLIRNVAPQVKRKLQQRARAHGRSLSEEAKLLLDQALSAPEPKLNLGEWMSNLVPAEYRGDDLVFEVPDFAREPPDFE